MDCTLKKIAVSEVDAIKMLLLETHFLNNLVKDGYVDFNTLIRQFMNMCKSYRSMVPETMGMFAQLLNQSELPQELLQGK